MKKILFIIIIISLCLPARSQGVVFEKITMKQALEKAAQENKHVFVDCYTSWCGPCRHMDAYVFPRSDVGDYFSSRFISVKFDVEKEEDGKKLKNEHDVTGYPTYLIINPDGSLLYKFSGAQDPPKFLRSVDEGFDDGRAYGSLQKAYETGSRHRELLRQVLDNFTSVRDPQTREVIGRLAGQLSDKEKTSPNYWFIYAIDLLDTVGSVNEQYLFDNVAKFRKNVGAEKVDPVLRRHYEARFTNIITNLIEKKENISDKDLLKMTRRAAKLDMGGDVNAFANIALADKSGDLDKLLVTAQIEIPNMESPLNPYFMLTERIMDNGTLEQKKAWLDFGETLLPLIIENKRFWQESLIKLMREREGL